MHCDNKKIRRWSRIWFLIRLIYISDCYVTKIKLIYMYNVMTIIIIVNSNSTKTQKQWYTWIFIWYVEHVILILGEIAR